MKSKNKKKDNATMSNKPKARQSSKGKPKPKPKQVEKKSKPLFRIFFPIVKNQKYPLKKNNLLAHLFIDQKQPLPSPFEVDILNQMFSLDALYQFKEITRQNERNKDMQQILFIKKHLRILTNIYHDQVQFWAIEQSEDLTTNNERNFTYQLVQLNETQAILKIKTYLRNKSSKLPQVPKPIDTNPFNAIKQSTLSTFNSLYNKSDLLSVDPNSTDHYSIIHSICEGFDFIVFDQSHKLKSETIIHESLKIRLRFPPGQNMFIIFNGHTAHCGAAAIEQSDIHSFSFQNSLRLFSYVSKSAEGTSKSSGVATRNNNKKTISDQESYKKVDKAAVKTCVECQLCDKEINSKMKHKKAWYHFGTLGIGHYRLDLNQCFNVVTNYGKNVQSCGLDDTIKKEKDESESPNKKARFDYSPTLIAGDLEEHGWAVYAGVDISSFHHFGVINEIEKTINKYGNKSKWKTIDKTTDMMTSNIGERKYLKFNEDIEKNDMKFVRTNAYFQSIQKLVHHIPNFENAVLKPHSHSILRNDGNVSEQYVHRDETTIDDNE